MVRFGEKPSRVEAACCRVLVMNGGAGFLFCSFRVIEAYLYICRSNLIGKLRRMFLAFNIEHAGSRASRPLRSRFPEDPLNLCRQWNIASLQILLPAQSEIFRESTNIQSVKNSLISFSLSQTNFNATDCTLPADKTGINRLPDNRADFVSDEPVHDTARLLSINKMRIDLERILHRTR